MVGWVVAGWMEGWMDGLEQLESAINGTFRKHFQSSADGAVRNPDGWEEYSESMTDGWMDGWI